MLSSVYIWWLKQSVLFDRSNVVDTTAPVSQRWGRFDHPPFPPPHTHTFFVGRWELVHTCAGGIRFLGCSDNGVFFACHFISMVLILLYIRISSIMAWLSNKTELDT